MLSVQKMSLGHEDYHLQLASEDYYLKGGEPPGQWVGGACAALGLEGKVDNEVFHNLFMGFSPDGKTALVKNAGKTGSKDYHKRCPGWDMAFSVPKSVSVCWSQAPPALRKQIVAAKDKAVRTALSMLEEFALETRRGKGGKIREKVAAVFAVFPHHTSRAEEQQLHDHAVLQNLGVRADGTTGAIRSNELYAYKMAAGALFRCDLATLLERDVHLRVQREGTSFELVGVNRDLMAAASTRRKQVVDQCAKIGVYTAKAAAVAAIKTKAAKSHISQQVLTPRWLEQGRQFGWSTEEAVKLCEPKPIAHDLAEEKKQLEKAIRLTIQESHGSLAKPKLLATVAQYAQGMGLRAREVLSVFEHVLQTSQEMTSGSRMRKPVPSEKPFERQVPARQKIQQAGLNARTKIAVSPAHISAAGREKVIQNHGCPAAIGPIAQQSLENETKLSQPVVIIDGRTGAVVKTGRRVPIGTGSSDQPVKNQQSAVNESARKENAAERNLPVRVILPKEIAVPQRSVVVSGKSDNRRNVKHISGPGHRPQQRPDQEKKPSQRPVIVVTASRQTLDDRREERGGANGSQQEQEKERPYGESKSRSFGGRKQDTAAEDLKALLKARNFWALAGFSVSELKWRELPATLIESKALGLKLEIDRKAVFPEAPGWSAAQGFKTRSLTAVIEAGPEYGPLKSGLNTPYFSVERRDKRLFPYAPKFMPVRDWKLPFLLIRPNPDPFGLNMRLKGFADETSKYVIKEIQTLVDKIIQAGASLTQSRDGYVPATERTNRSPKNAGLLTDLSIGKQHWETVKKLVDDWSRRGVGQPRHNLMVSATRDSADVLNRLAHRERLFAGFLGDESANVNDRFIHRKDRVRLTENFPSLGVREGDIGTVTRATNQKLSVFLDSGKLVRLPLDKYQAVEYAYAFTHDTVGSQIAKRVFMLFEGALLSNELNEINRQTWNSRVKVYTQVNAAQRAYHQLSKNLDPNHASSQSQEQDSEHEHEQSP